ncbi:DUF559 domain-containing protein [Mycobacteroides chelonae]|uniref:DUF559 domain-containing protein n=1 Tax=Mycobacteroides chelonae TaxID=1774 RepID=UPI0004AB37D5|nr:DUF559 domain-containing protein [Mycobacteroides chelonae]MBF9317073.1 DUF559 domain-containing protein [Mycobacteroides chelonae]OHT67965.1 hypothetical protein BKG66_20505 [Mycobacteroides chelonae]OHT69838.1 hypothetical protein BKG67_19055 [Mycobacteroides chelonae]OHT83687.1 hypothetical protein BKG70_19215 [Mycobacteroides chelonae]
MGDIPWPFRSADVLASGAISERRMRRLYRQLYPGVFVPRDAQLSATERAVAAWHWSRRQGIVAGLSASALHGAKWIDGDRPAELVFDNYRTPSGLTVHQDSLLANEITEVHGTNATTPARTAFDLGRRLTLGHAVERIDALMNATGLTTPEVHAVLADHPGVRGVVRLREVLELVDAGAESPQETRTRLLVVRSGFPKPQTQIRVLDRFGDFVARVDMGWEDAKVGVEFDGAQHWTDPRQRSRDIDRAAALTDEGWTIIRVTSELLRHRPGTIVSRVDEALQMASLRLTTVFPPKAS